MLIGVSGKKRTGKDLTASIIQWLLSDQDVPVEAFINSSKLERNEYATIRCMSFAHKIKLHVSDVLGVPVEQMDDEEWRSKDLDLEWEYIDNNIKKVYTPRLLMQKIGTDMARAIHPDYWVNALFIDYDPMENWAITDVRFPNEVKAITRNGGLVIRIERETGLIDKHASEHALDMYPFTYYINNNGTIEDLVVAVREILIKNGFKVKR